MWLHTNIYVYANMLKLFVDELFHGVIINARLKCDRGFSVCNKQIILLDHSVVWHLRISFT